MHRGGSLIRTPKQDHFNHIQSTVGARQEEFKAKREAEELARKEQAAALAVRKAGDTARVRRALC